MNTDLAAELTRKHSAVLDKFGETVTLWPGQPAECTATAVLYRSGRAEPRSPGDAESMFLVPAGLPETPAKGDFVGVGTTIYAITNSTDNGDGSLTLLLRKKN